MLNQLEFPRFRCIIYPDSLQVIYKNHNMTTPQNPPYTPRHLPPYPPLPLDLRSKSRSSFPGSLASPSPSLSFSRLTVRIAALNKLKKYPPNASVHPDPEVLSGMVLPGPYQFCSGSRPLLRRPAWTIGVAAQSRRRPFPAFVEEIAGEKDGVGF